MSTADDLDLVQQVRVKVAASPPDLDQSPLIPVFHRWIRERRLGGRLLIDVADYRHVPRGPGVMLIGHDGHLSMDAGGRGLGLAYERKRDEPGPIAGKLTEALSIVLEACEQLAREPELQGVPGGLRFDPFDLDIEVRSRLHAPNTPETHAALGPAIARALAAVYLSGADAEVPAAVDVEPLTGRGAPFGVRARIAGRSAGAQPGGAEPTGADSLAEIGQLRARLAAARQNTAPVA